MIFLSGIICRGSGGILVQSTLKTLGYEVDLLDLAKVEIPVAIFAVVVAIVYYYLKDKKLFKKYYGTAAIEESNETKKQ